MSYPRFGSPGYDFRTDNPDDMLRKLEARVSEKYEIQSAELHKRNVALETTIQIKDAVIELMAKELAVIQKSKEMERARSAV